MNVTSDDRDGDTITVALAQIAPVLLDRAATLDRVIAACRAAGTAAADLVCFGEALVPGYPFWVERLHGAEFDSPVQRALHARYLDQAVSIERGDLAGVQDEARSHGLTVQLGVIERPADRGGHSLYASLVTIDARGDIVGVHRKLQPTYEERLTWAPGDGHGLRTHHIGPFTMGGLNCWENWMPLPRAALYGMGEDLHVAVWPGSDRNTSELTRFLAREGRSYVCSVSGVLHADDIPTEIPELAPLRRIAAGWLANGGSCVAAPDATWVLTPQCDSWGLHYATLSHQRVREERQNFDPAGHYARPDVTRLWVDRRRQTTVTTQDDP